MGNGHISETTWGPIRQTLADFAAKIPDLLAQEPNYPEFGVIDFTSNTIRNPASERYYGFQVNPSIIRIVMFTQSLKADKHQDSSAVHVIDIFNPYITGYLSAGYSDMDDNHREFPQAKALHDRSMAEVQAIKNAVLLFYQDEDTREMFSQLHAKFGDDESQLELGTFENLLFDSIFSVYSLFNNARLLSYMPNKKLHQLILEVDLRELLKVMHRDVNSVVADTFPPGAFLNPDQTLTEDVVLKAAEISAARARVNGKKGRPCPQLAHLPEWFAICGEIFRHLGI